MTREEWDSIGEDDNVVLLHPKKTNGANGQLDPDREQLKLFFETLFKYASAGNWVSLRSFPDKGERKSEIPCRIKPIKLNGKFDELIDKACHEIAIVANEDQKIVFCPPIATFSNADHAREIDLAEGFTISTECDDDPQAARTTLGKLLGLPTMVVQSGGEWINPATGEIEPKLHIHYRLKEPARDKDALAKLKAARKLATHIVHGDPTNTPVGHPIRWAGSWHRKHEPRLTRIIEINPDAEIVDLDKVLEVLKAVAPEVDYREHEANGALQADPDLIYAAMELVPNDGEVPGDPYEWKIWKDVIGTIHAATGGVERGREAAHMWSAKSPKYDAENTDDEWEHLHGYPYTKKGAGSIIWWGKQVDPDWQRKYWQQLVASANTPFGRLAAMRQTNEKPKQKTKAEKSFWELITDAEQTQPKKPEELPRLEYLTLKDLRQETLEHVAWIVPGFILAEAVNGLFGAGAVGKDLLLFQLAVALVSIGKWLGLEVPTTWNGEPIRVLWFPVEDPKKELRRRQHSIETHYAQQAKYRGETYVSHDDNLRIIPKRKGDGTVIAVYDREAGMVTPTERYAQICAEIEDFKPHVVIMGNRVNIFSVNQNDDAQARQCMELLDDLCEAYGVTVIMPAHPSLGGQSSGSGESGTVQWNNACRGRCYLSKIKGDKNDPDPDPDVRQLEVMKNNWSASGTIINMRWTKVLDAKGDWYGGVFVEDQVVQVAVKDESGVIKSDAQIKAEEDDKIDADFMEMFDKATKMGLTLSHKTRAENNPAVKFAEFPECRYRTRKGRQQMRDAMMRLLAKGVIEIKTGGSPSRPWEKLARTGLRLVVDNEPSDGGE